MYIKVMVKRKMGPQPKITDKMRDSILRDKLQPKELAAKYGIHASTIYAILRKGLKKA